MSSSKRVIVSKLTVAVAIGAAIDDAVRHCAATLAELEQELASGVVSSATARRMREVTAKLEQLETRGVRLDLKQLLGFRPSAAERRRAQRIVRALERDGIIFVGGSRATWIQISDLGRELLQGRVQAAAPLPDDDDDEPVFAHLVRCKHCHVPDRYRIRGGTYRPFGADSHVKIQYALCLSCGKSFRIHWD